MVILQQHQVVCTIKLWYRKIFMGNFKEGGVLMVLPQKLDYVYISGIRSWTIKAISPYL